MTFEDIWSKNCQNHLKRACPHNNLRRIEAGVTKLGASWVDLGYDCIWCNLTLTFKGSKSAKNGLVHTITFKGLMLGSPNLVIRCIMGKSWMRLYMVGFDLNLQGHLGSKRSKSAKNGLVRAITFKGLKLGSPNLAIGCIMGRSWMGLYMVGFDLDIQGHLGSKLSTSAENGLVHTMTFEGLKLGSPNMDISCIIA